MKFKRRTSENLIKEEKDKIYDEIRLFYGKKGIDSQQIENAIEATRDHEEHCQTCNKLHDKGALR